MFITLYNSQTLSSHNITFCVDLITQESLINAAPYKEQKNLASWLTVSFSLFLIGVAGMVYNWKNFLITMMCIELMYLGTITGFILYGLAFHDVTAAVYALLVLIFAACESAVGLGLLVVARTYEDTLDASRFMLLGG
jgi:NADH-quinone oxidoreductase subunit K